VEMNQFSHLSAGDIPKPRIYIAVSFAFSLLTVLWINLLCKPEANVYSVHKLMTVLLILKVNILISLVIVEYHVLGSFDPLTWYELLFPFAVRTRTRNLVIHVLYFSLTKRPSFVRDIDFDRHWLQFFPKLLN
jgi:hypothetical protein